MKRAWLGQIAGILVALVVILWFIQARRAPVQMLERRDCQHAYAVARTRADTVAVDGRQPLGATRTDSLAPTCGSLRKTGKL
ncbi:MAG: hypothetical protein ABR537_11045 [Gemmatimonadales bacterium]